MPYGFTELHWFLYFHSEDPYIFYGYKQNSITSSCLGQTIIIEKISFFNCNIHLFYILLLQDAMKGNKDECYCNWLLKVPNFCLCGHEWAWPTQRERQRKEERRGLLQLVTGCRSDSHHTTLWSFLIEIVQKIAGIFGLLTLSYESKKNVHL